MIQVKTPDLGSIVDSVEASLTCTNEGVEVVLGGSCAETDVSARVSVHIAMAVGASQLLAKPGMGVDEPLMIANNEITRVLRLDTERRSAAVDA